MSIFAISTPVRCAGVPSDLNATQIMADEDYVVWKDYKCGIKEGHIFTVTFDSPLDLPVMWECAEHEVVAFEA